MKRIKELERKMNRKIFTVRGYLITTDTNDKYVLWAKNMANACELVPLKLCNGITNIYEIEKKYCKPYDKTQGQQYEKPFWYYGRVYKIS